MNDSRGMHVRQAVEVRRNLAIDLLRRQVGELVLDDGDYVKVGEEGHRIHKDRLVTLMESGRLAPDTILRRSRESVERLASDALDELDSQLEVFEIVPIGEKSGIWTIDFVDEEGGHVEVAIDQDIVGMDDPTIQAHIRAKLNR